jgi:hypothetical protein
MNSLPESSISQEIHQDALVAATLLAQNSKNYTKDEQNIIQKSSSSYKFHNPHEHNSLFCFHTTTKCKTERASGVGKIKQKNLKP